MSTTKIDTDDFGDRAPWEAPLLEAVRSVRFGSVEVVIHDGRVTQIETREKVRFAADPRLPDDRRREPTPEGRTDQATGGTGSERKR